MNLPYLQGRANAQDGGSSNFGQERELLAFIEAHPIG